MTVTQLLCPLGQLLRLQRQRVEYRTRVPDHWLVLLHGRDGLQADALGRHLHLRFHLHPPRLSLRDREDHQRLPREDTKRQTARHATPDVSRRNPVAQLPDRIQAGAARKARQVEQQHCTHLLRHSGSPDCSYLLQRHHRQKLR